MLRRHVGDLADAVKIAVSPRGLGQGAQKTDGGRNATIRVLGPLPDGVILSTPFDNGDKEV